MNSGSSEAATSCSGRCVRSSKESSAGSSDSDRFGSVALIRDAAMIVSGSLSTSKYDSWPGYTSSWPVETGLFRARCPVLRLLEPLRLALLLRPASRSASASDSASATASRSARLLRSASWARSALDTATSACSSAVASWAPDAIVGKMVASRAAKHSPRASRAIGSVCFSPVGRTWGAQSHLEVQYLLIWRAGCSSQARP
mmetsp:Transcript_64706/g.174835  ORF Transcript_64706/g.174835 Transcript_64706/m.174835 type:complete len:201 (-) Transcript_64706:6-608(-)